MKVLHVYSGNLFGGIETMLLALAEAEGSTDARTRTHEFAACFDERLASELRAAGARVHLLGAVRLSRPASAHRARRALSAVLHAGAFDRVICHAPWAQAIFGSVVRRHRVPLAFWAHDRMNGRHWTERLARHVRPQLVIANSTFTARTQAALYPGLPSAVVYPPARAVAPTRSRRHVRMSLGTPQDHVVIVQASRCEAWKGHHLLLEALAHVRTIPGWTWWIVGGAQRPDEAAYVAELRDAAHRYGIADRIAWLGQRPDVATLLAAADVYCQANVQPEPFGLAFVEALAAGLPVVSVRHGGVMEIVDDSCARLVPPGDVDALASTRIRIGVTTSLTMKKDGTGAPPPTVSVWDAVVTWPASSVALSTTVNVPAD